MLSDTMNRILVIGGNGAGKTTFSIKLAEKTGLPLTHLDRLFWYGHWQSRTEEEFDALLMEVLRQPRWIIDGNYGRTIPLRAGYCDTLIFLDVSTPRCLWSIVKRVLKNYGRSRPDMGGDCPERFDPEFMRHAMRLPKRVRQRYERMLQDPAFAHLTFLRLKGRRQAERFLRSFEEVPEGRHRHRRRLMPGLVGDVYEGD